MRFDDMKPVYDELWSTCTIRQDKKTLGTVAWARETLLANKAKYQEAQRRSGLWWPVIGCVHMLESSFSFKGHLHNGDPLTARTVQVPAGRPRTGRAPFSWEESAADALSMKRWVLDELGAIDTPAECLYYLENYNGWGYQSGAGRATTPAKRSPYLWSMTNHYARGKYTSDGRFDRWAVSAQVGAAAVLKAMVAAGDISFDLLPSPELPKADFKPYAAAPVPLGFTREMGFSDKGQDVFVLGCALVGLGVLPPRQLVGDVFNEETHDGVVAFQTRFGLNPDGLVGPKTTASIEARLTAVRR